MDAYLKILLLLLSVGLISGQFFNFQRRSTQCFNPNQRRGSCVSIYDCQTMLSVLQRQPLMEIDRQFIRDSECQGGYGRQPYVCCTSDTGFVRESRTTPNFSQDFYSWNGSPSTGFFPEDTGATTRAFSDNQPGWQSGSASSNLAAGTLPQPPVCGGVTISNKIYGGSDADLNEFPWLVLLEYNRGPRGMSINCAGSLINRRYVLTAAHCVKGAIEQRIGQLVTVRLGEHDTSQSVDCNQFGCAPEAHRVGIEQIIPHERYRDSSSNKENDIALLRLDRNVRYSSSLRPVCLPSAVSESDPIPGTELTVVGWGRTGRSARSAVKQKLNVDLWDQQSCRRRYGERKVKIADSQVCAGGKFAEDSCDGDSGGPLMRFNGAAWVLEGIVSFGVKCGLRDWPAVHTRVASYDGWIRSHMRP